MLDLLPGIIDVTDPRKLFGVAKKLGTKLPPARIFFNGKSLLKCSIFNRFQSADKWYVSLLIMVYNISNFRSENTEKDWY